LKKAEWGYVLILILCPAVARSFDYEHRFTKHEHRCAEHDASARKELRGRFFDGMLTIDVNGSQWPTRYPLQNARITKCTGATGGAFP